MARIVCFSDDVAFLRIMQQELGDNEHEVCLLPASHLSHEVRDLVRQLSPDVIVLEINRATDNPHLYFFLRSDDTTRSTPIILLSSGAQVEQQARLLGADGFLLRSAGAEQIRMALSRHLPPVAALVAA